MVVNMDQFDMMETEAPPMLVLGLGNILMQDEGIGVAVVDRLQQHFKVSDQVELLDGGTSGMTLLDDLRNRQQVIVVDAVRTGNEPGSIVVLRGEEIPAFFKSKVSPHQLALSDVLAVLTMTDEQPGEITVIGIEPISLETHMGLSEEVAEQLVPLTDLVVEELRQHEYPVEQIENDTEHDYLSLMSYPEELK